MKQLAKGLLVAALVWAGGVIAQPLEAPGLKASVAKRAYQALTCAKRYGADPKMVIVVDMSMPSYQRRLWAFEWRDKPELILNDYVAHGRGSDPDGNGVPQAFGNELGSGMTALGAYQVAEQYEGKYGLSRRLDGLMRGWNEAARERAVVLHPSNYVRPGAVGRSLGCPAVQYDTIELLEKNDLTGALLWIDGPDQRLNDAVATCNGKGWFTPPSVHDEAVPVVPMSRPEEKNPIWAFTRMCVECPFGSNQAFME